MHLCSLLALQRFDAPTHLISTESMQCSNGKMKEEGEEAEEMGARKRKGNCIFLYKQRRRQKLTLFEKFMRTNRKGANTVHTANGVQRMRRVEK